MWCVVMSGERTPCPMTLKTFVTSRRTGRPGLPSLITELSGPMWLSGYKADLGENKHLLYSSPLCGARLGFHTGRMHQALQLSCERVAQQALFSLWHVDLPFISILSPSQEVNLLNSLRSNSPDAPVKNVMFKGNGSSASPSAVPERKH